MGRTATGVRGISLGEGDEVIGMVIVNEDHTLLTVCEHGNGKRTEFSEYRQQSRGGKGIINIRTSEKNGDVVSIKAVHEDNDLMLVTQSGMVTRLPVHQISLIGRATQGVRLMAPRVGDRVVSAALVQNGKHHDEDENAGDENPRDGTPDDAPPEGVGETPADEKRPLPDDGPEDGPEDGDADQ